jgi:hypothetical protein
MIRLLRVLRLIKFQKIKPYLRGYMSLSSPFLSSIMSIMKATFTLLVGLHITACCWHFLGDSLADGWVIASGLQNAPVMRRYSMALHWLFLHIQTDRGGIRIDTTLEYLVDSAICLSTFLLCSHYVGVMVNLVFTYENSTVSKINSIARRYIKRHNIPYELAYRLRQCLSVNQIGGPVEILNEETMLLNAFPVRMQVDLQYAVRLEMTQSMVLFMDMKERTPRVVRSLTHKMNMLVAIEKETIFALGDVCSQMLFITGGQFEYQCDEDILFLTPRPKQRPRHQKSRSGCDYLCNGDLVSEAVLWTTWEHHGALLSGADSLMVCMDASTFSKEITAHPRATVHAVKYARHFCWHMNRAEVSDLMGFNLTVATLDIELHIGGLEDHFAFISHYKVEAGTEATLLKDELEIAIGRDPSNPAGDFKTPVFLDSEDLVDLTRLMNHAKGSLALIVLLTPQVLSRPWCLLEFVAAYKSDRPYVPVLLVRPGITYQFPDEDFYESLRNDEIIGVDGRQLIEDNGFNMQEVEEAVRAVFTMIALPYSPHKSAAVRGGEVSDILKRCMKLTANGLRDWGASDISTFLEDE